MKKYIYYILVGTVAVLSFASCNEKAFLTEQPKTIYTKENAFDKESQVDASLVNCYDKFCGMFHVNGWFGGGDNAASALMGDGADVLGSSQGSQSAPGSFSNYKSLKSDNGTFSTIWQGMYQLAAYANLTLYGAEQVEWIKESDKAYAIAQARFFRGWAYLRLAEVFGGVPIVDSYSEELKFDYVRNTRSETYSFAIEDFKAAVNGLPDYPLQDGRVAKGIANHYLAEAYLGLAAETGDASKYNDAIAAADAVIASHPLMVNRFGSRANPNDPGFMNGVPNYKADGNVYYDLFQIGNYDYSEGNTESLMAVQVPTYDMMAGNGGAGISVAYTWACGPAYRDLSWSDEMKAQNQNGGPWMGPIDQQKFPGGQLSCYFGGSWGLYGATDYSDEYVWRDQYADDYRNSELCRTNPVVMDMSSPQYLQICKKEWLADPAYLSRVSCKWLLQDMWGWDMAHCGGMAGMFTNMYGRDIYVARSAETYLLRAEAKLLNGDKKGAADDINAVRARSNAKYMIPEGDVDMYTILDERARELAWEEHRWPTLLRMGGNGKNDIMKTQLTKFAFAYYDAPICAGQGFPEWTLFAIPKSVRDLNSDADLEQNPGWDK